jgi:hypothetical protein
MRLDRTKLPQRRLLIFLDSLIYVCLVLEVELN